jgi:hypothetical protein
MVMSMASANTYHGVNVSSRSTIEPAAPTIAA